jgi:hypothetical protein
LTVLAALSDELQAAGSRWGYWLACWIAKPCLGGRQARAALRSELALMEQWLLDEAERTHLLAVGVECGVARKPSESFADFVERLPHDELVVSLAGALAVVKIPDGAPTSMVGRLLSEQLPGVEAMVDGDTIALKTSQSVLPVRFSTRASNRRPRL